MTGKTLTVGAVSAGIVLAAAIGPVLAGPSRPVELGQVRWLRSLPEAVPLAKEQGKPIFLLFQEVPGCLTCQNYGHKVLSHPLIVEAIESRFIPVVIFNNRGGQDAATLKQYNEPSWNNPVVRIVSADQKDLVPRLSGDYSRGGLVARMTDALARHGSPVPEYLQLLDEELSARDGHTEKSVFAMFCFWSGEGMFGNLDGVISTQSGFLKGHEVVEVEYDPRRLPYEKLVDQARRHDMAGRVYARNRDQLRIAERSVGSAAQLVGDPIRPDREPKYYLAQTPLKHVPMTDLQAARVNAAVGSRADFIRYLSPRQLALLRVIQKHPQAGWPDMIGHGDLIGSWQKVTEKAAALDEDDRA